MSILKYFVRHERKSQNQDKIGFDMFTQLKRDIVSKYHRIADFLCVAHF